MSDRRNEGASPSGTGVSPTAEQWRLIPGLEPTYSASTAGRIRNNRTGRVLDGEVDADGYRRVHLYRAGKRFKQRAHRLVCMTFHGPQPDGCEVGHLDGQPQHNAPNNLAWVTRSENVRQSIAHGTFAGDIASLNAARKRIGK